MYQHALLRYKEPSFCTFFLSVKLFLFVWLPLRGSSHWTEGQRLQQSTNNSYPAAIINIRHLYASLGYLEEKKKNIKNTQQEHKWSDISKNVRVPCAIRVANNGLCRFRDQNASRTFHPVHNLTGAPFTNRFHDESHRETFCGCPLSTAEDVV